MFRKELNELESSTVFGVSKENTIECVNLDSAIKIKIEKLTLEKALSIGTSRRSYFYHKKKLTQNQKINTMTKLVSET